jgi:hypothetical protein
MKRRFGAAVFLVLSTLLAAPAMADRDVHRHPGHRGRPYDPHRHYERHEYGGRQYVYRGHWRSWDDWDRYYRAHPHLHGRGHYYHDDVHLMYRYCDGDGSCFFFSIGR